MGIIIIRSHPHEMMSYFQDFMASYGSIFMADCDGDYYQGHDYDYPNYKQQYRFHQMIDGE